MKASISVSLNVEFRAKKLPEFDERHESMHPGISTNSNRINSKIYTLRHTLKVFSKAKNRDILESSRKEAICHVKKNHQ